MAEDELGFNRETEICEVRKKSVPQDYRGRDYGFAEALTYRKEGPDGSSRNLNIDEVGVITLYGRQPMSEVYGLENEIFSHQTTLSDLGKEEVANNLVQYHREDSYSELDEILREVEEQIFDTR